MREELELEDLPIEDEASLSRTSYDAEGRVTGTQLADGTWITPAPSNVGKRVVADGVEMVVAWDGAVPDRYGGNTKGELLGPYKTLSSIWDALRRSFLLQK